MKVSSAGVWHWSECWGLGAVVLVCCTCSRDKPTGSETVSASPSVLSPAPTLSRQYDILYFPDGGDQALFSGPAPERLPRLPSFRGVCPADMVQVREFCIDRYEDVLVDRIQGRRLTPYYPPTRDLARWVWSHWQKKRPAAKTRLGRTTPVLPPSKWTLGEVHEPRAVSLPGEVPHGYMSGVLAELACKNAGKRLCTSEEWVTACQGQEGRKFPYGNEYIPGRCNVSRSAHPAATLHGNASIGHTDPRLNAVQDNGKPLLRRTGATPSCKSQWGEDGVYDMVGNLDEWVDEPDGAFLGGFFSRSTREGCEARVSSHPPEYWDYSLGVRCCKSASQSTAHPLYK